MIALIATTSAGGEFRAIGLTVFALVLIAFVALWARNIFKSRSELGSEIELAANRKEYLSDEELEGEKLDKSLTFALVMLALLAIVLPFYWLAEPGRQDGAVDAYNLSFEVQGSNTYAQGAQCVNCHAAGGVGGVADYVLQDADGQFLANAQWQAPALNNVLLRYSEDEVRYVLNFGRPGSPMAAWGTPGGGPLTTQQVDNTIIYLRTLQVQSLDTVEIALAGSEDPNDDESIAAQEAAADLTTAINEEVQRSLDAGEFSTVGEAVFNLGLYSGYQGGALSCGRCHTAGWSLGPNVVPDLLAAGVAGCGGGNPSGIGYNLCGGSVKDRFPDDFWKAADGGWLPPEGLSDDEGFFIEAADGSPIRLDENGVPVNDDGFPYIVLGEARADGAAPADEAASAEVSESADDVDTTTTAEDTTTTTADDDGALTADVSDERIGDLADCGYVSQLWEGATGGTYPFAPDYELEVDENGEFVDPDELTPADVPGEMIELSDGRLAGDCTIIEMPERTSYAHYDFIYNGAEAGSGYGRGGLSAAGMMPGFGHTLPPELIQAVVDYERGL